MIKKIIYRWENDKKRGETDGRMMKKRRDREENDETEKEERQRGECYSRKEEIQRGKG